MPWARSLRSYYFSVNCDFYIWIFYNSYSYYFFLYSSSNILSSFLLSIESSLLIVLAFGLITVFLYFHLLASLSIIFWSVFILLNCLKFYSLYKIRYLLVSYIKKTYALLLVTESLLSINDWSWLYITALPLLEMLLNEFL